MTQGNPFDQVGTVDTTGTGSKKIPDVEDAIVSPEYLEAAAEAGEEGLSPEQLEEIPLTLAESKAAAEEESAEESAEVAGEEAVPEEVPAEEEAAEEEAEVTESGYDPADHSVAEVVTYLQNHPDEKGAVIASEKQGKDRKGITSLEEEG